MRHHLATPATRHALGALALWLALWTMGDAATGASRITVIVGEPACPPPAATSHCAGQATPASAPCCGPSCDPDAGPSCDPGAGPSRCPVGKTVRCTQCFTLGGMLLFAAAPLSLEPDRTVEGLMCPCCLPVPSHHLQPPVPPPWSLA